MQQPLLLWIPCLISWLKFNLSGLLSGSAVLVEADSNQIKLLNRVCFGRPIMTAAAGPSSSLKARSKTSDKETNMADEEEAIVKQEEEEHDKKEIKDKIKEKRRTKILNENAKLKKKGVCYLSRIPPHMKPLKLRQILSQYGEVLKIYLAPEDPVVRLRRRRAGGNRGKEFTEGWVEFAKKSVAKKVASMLNGEQIGGKRRSSHYYDLWNIKYLHKFKWDNLTEEIAYKNAVREQKLAMELTAAKKERDFYLSKVDQSRSMSFIEERLKKKRKREFEGSDATLDLVTDDPEPKVIRFFPQRKSIADAASQSSPSLSKDFLAGVFGQTSS